MWLQGVRADGVNCRRQVSAGLDTTRLEKVRQTGGKTIGRCPACAETGDDASGEHLVIKSDGRFGCIKYPGPEGAEHRKRIFALVGIVEPKTTHTPRPTTARPARTFTTAEQAAKQCTPQGATLETVYPYPHKIGATARYSTTDGKTFRQFHATPAGWAPGAPAGKWPPYAVDALSPDGLIFIVEGEGCQHAAAGIGLAAVTSAGGSKAAAKTDWTPLAGRDVMILPDNDPPSTAYAADVTRILGALNPPARVRIVRLPGLPEGGDIVNFIEARPGQKPEEIRQEIERLTAKASAPEPEPWEKPIGFDAPINLPAFPVDVLPPPFNLFVADVSASKQVPTALPCALVLGAVALAVAKRFRVYIGQSHDEPLNLFSLALMEPGSRKSDTFRACLAPIENFEIELAQHAKPAIARAAERRAIEEARLTEIRKRAGRCDDIQERQKLTIEAEDLGANLTEIPIPPRMIAGDISPEHLASLLCANGGRMAVADAEGGLIFEIMAGRYTKNGGPNIEIFLKGHAGDAIRVDRSGRPSEFARTAALTCILTAQPTILRNLAAKDQMRGRGLLARFLFTMPSGMIGERSYANKPMDAQLVEQYATRMYDLLAVPPLDPDEPEAHRRLNLDGEALEIWRSYHDRIEKAQAPDGELSYMTDFASKLPGAVARMAGLLHLMKYGPQAPKDIEPETAAGAWALGLFFLEHTKAAFAELGAGGDIGLARRVYSWISRNRPERFTLGVLFDDLRRGAGLDLSDDLLPAMEILEDRNIIRREPPPPGNKPGRKSLGSWEVNRKIVSGEVI